MRALGRTQVYALLITFTKFCNGYIHACDPSSCPINNDGFMECKMGDSSFRNVGITKVQSSINSQPLTWTLGIERIWNRGNDSRQTFDRNYYFGTPSGWKSSEGQIGCAIIFESVTTSLLFPQSGGGYSNGTCRDALGSTCAADLEEQMHSTVSSMAAGGVPPKFICGSLAATLRFDVPPSCNIRGRGRPDIWGDLEVKDLFSSNSKPVPNGTCHPTTEKDYDLTLIESHRRTGVYNDLSVINRIMDGVTPIITLILHNATENPQTRLKTSKADAVLSCLRTTSPIGNAAQTMSNDAKTLLGISYFTLFWMVLGCI